MLIDPDGTPHYLGAGGASTQGTYQTTDGTQITYVGNAMSGSTLYYPDHTLSGIGYNAAGQVTGQTLGNGVVCSFSCCGRDRSS